MKDWVARGSAFFSSNRRLSLAGLDPVAKLLAVAGLIVLALASAFVVFFALGWTVPGGVEQVYLEGVPQEVPRAATALAYLALATGAAIAVAAARDLRGPQEWAVRGGVGFVGAALAGIQLQGARLLDANPLGYGTIGTFAHVSGWLALLAAALLALTPPAYARRAGPAMIAAAALPGLLTGGLYVLWPNVAGPPGSVGLSSHGILALGVLSLIAALTIVVSIYVLWQAIAGIQASRAGAARMATGLEGRPLYWLSAILALKLVWLALGYANLLPAGLGGGSGSWEDSRLDGLLSWTLAVCFATAALIALARLPLQRIDERGLRPVMVALTAVFTAFFALGGIALLLYAALGAFADEGALRAALVDAMNWLSEGILWSTVIAVLAAAVAAFGLLLLRRSWVGLPFLLVFVIWSLPRALQATPGLSDEEPFRHLGVNVVTFDAMLTVALAVALVCWYRNKQRRLPPVEVALVLAVSTLVAQTSTLLGGWNGEAYFYVALVFPAAYLFLFGAADLNREGPTRSRRVLATIGAASVLLSLVAVQLVLGSIGPGRLSAADLVQVVMAVPIAGVLVGVALAELRSTKSAPGAGSQTALS